MNLLLTVISYAAWFFLGIYVGLNKLITGFSLNQFFPKKKSVLTPAKKLSSTKKSAKKAPVKKASTKKTPAKKAVKKSPPAKKKTQSKK